MGSSLHIDTAVSIKSGAAASTGWQPVCSSKHIPNLDALRGISILWVFLHHVPALPWPWARVIQENGRHGVSFFFVISGFLICTLFLREERDTGRIELLKFYGRRVLRLMPLYYITLLVYVVLVLALGVYSAENRALFIEKLPSYILYYSNVVPRSTEGPFFFAWSLAVEEQFYLFFGMCMRWLSKKAVLALVVAMLALKIGVLAFYGPGLLETTAFRIALSYQEAILIGVLLAFAMSSAQVGPTLSRPLSKRGVPWALGAAIAAIVLVGTIEGRSSARAELLYMLMALFVGSVCLRRELGGLFGRAAAHIGKVSYGMYLLHMLVINSTRKVLDNPLFVLAVGVPVTVALATAVYRCIELPILRLRDRLKPGARRRAAEAAPRVEIMPSVTN
jgi:peptidoglycan/LPS O-acetylase OafA/YrhL